MAEVRLSKAAQSVLGIEELAAALSSPNRSALAVHAAFESTSKRLAIVMGDGRLVRVPLSRLLRKASPTKRNLRQLELIDYGQTLCLGDYQVAIDAVVPVA